MNWWIGFVVLGGLGQCLVWFSSFYKHPSFCFCIGSVMWARRKLDTISFPSLFITCPEICFYFQVNVYEMVSQLSPWHVCRPTQLSLVIASRVKCAPSLLAAHTPSGCPLHSSHPKVTIRWHLFLPCDFWKLTLVSPRRKGFRDDIGSQLCGCQSVLSPHPHLHLYFSDLIPFLRMTYSPPRPWPGCLDFFFFKV